MRGGGKLGVKKRSQELSNSEREEIDHVENVALAKAIGGVFPALERRGEQEDFEHGIWEESLRAAAAAGRIEDDTLARLDPAGRTSWYVVLGFSRTTDDANVTKYVITDQNGKARFGFRGPSFKQVLWAYDRLEPFGYTTGIARSDLLLEDAETWINTFATIKENIIAATDASTSKEANKLAHEVDGLEIGSSQNQKAKDDRGGIRPPQPYRCMGRDDELDRIAERVCATEGAAIIVHGPPGIGKTTLACAAASDSRIQEKFGNRRFFVALENVTSINQFRDAVKAALGASPNEGGSARDIVVSIGPIRQLVILDNFETIWEADPQSIEHELAEVTTLPNVFVLVSFRGNDLPAIPAWSHRQELKPLLPDDARDLFLELAPRVSPLDPDLVPLLSELGGLPLAIELVALEAKAFEHVADVLNEWKRIGTTLAKRADVPEGRLSSLAHSIELSLSSPRRSRLGRRLLSIVAWLEGSADKKLCKELLGDDFYGGFRDIVAAGLCFQRDNRLYLLPPISRYLRDFYPVSELDVHQVLSYYVKLFSLLHKKNFSSDEAFYRRVIVEDYRSICCVLPYTAHRLGLDPMLLLATQLRDAMVHFVNASTKPGRGYEEESYHKFALGILTQFSHVTHFVAICSVARCDVKRYEDFMVASAGLDQARVDLMLHAAQHQIDELRRVFPAHLECIAVADNLQEDLNTTRDSDNVVKAMGETDEELLKCLMREFKGWGLLRNYRWVGSFGVEDADRETQSWDGLHSARIAYDAVTAAFGPDRYPSLVCAHWLAEETCAAGDFAEAERLYDDLAIKENQMVHMYNPQSFRGMAVVLKALGRIEEADTLLSAAEQREKYDRMIAEAEDQWKPWRPPNPPSSN